MRSTAPPDAHARLSSVLSFSSIGNIRQQPLSAAGRRAGPQGLSAPPRPGRASPYGARRWPFPLAPVYNGGKSNTSLLSPLLSGYSNVFVQWGAACELDHNQNVMCSWEIPCVRREPSALRHSGMVAEHGGPPIPWYSVERVEDDGMHFPPQEGIRCLQQQLAISTPSTLNGSSPTLWALCWAESLRHRAGAW